MINIKMLEKTSLKGYSFIEGFPGAGLVGPMAISYIIDKLGMKYVGYIDSEDFPPIVAIHNDRPMPPVRVYASDKAKIVTVLAEFAVPIDVTHELATTLYNFMKSAGVTKIVSIGGIPSNQQNIENEIVFAISSNDAAKKEAQKAGMKPVGEGVATGVSALLLINSVMDSVSDVNILVPVDPNILDPKYAELAIISANKLIKLNVDVSELDKEAKAVEARISELLKKNREAQEVHKKVVDEAGAPMYA